MRPEPRRRAGWLLAAVFTLLAGGARAADYQLPPYTEARLPNGARVLLMERHDVPLVALQARVAGGSLADAPGREGGMALLAEWLRRGAGSRTQAQFTEAVEGAGGSLQTAVEIDHLQLEARFLARDAGLMLELVSDALQRPRLDAGEFQRLRQQAIASLASERDGSPLGLIARYGLAWLYRGLPLGRPSGGDETSLAALQPEDLRRLWRDQLGGDRLVLAVAGDFDADAMLAALTRQFGAWAAASRPPPEAPASPPQQGRRVLLVDKPGATQTHFWLGNRGRAADDPARVPQDLATLAFGGSFISMLNRALRVDSGLTYGARASLRRHRDAGTLAISSYCARDNTARALDLTLKTLAALHDPGISDATLEQTRQLALGQFPLGLETAAQLADALAAQAFNRLGRDDVDGYGEAVRATTPEMLRAAIASTYPQPQDLAIVVIGDAAALREGLGALGPLTEIPLAAPRFSVPVRPKPG